jgi:hypothetical protein
MGFSKSALDLLSNYFTNRKQQVKFENCYSDFEINSLGCPQGGVNSPLMFLLFINDIGFYLQNCNTLLFADDTTISWISSNYDNLMNNFHETIIKLVEWCNFNRLDINWDKTKIMFITKQMEKYLIDSNIEKKRIKTFPITIAIKDNDVFQEVQVVDSFKLLGITIDNRLNFLKYVADLRLAVNKRLYSIKRLFYLPFSVKLQFFKTFILPHFNYCSTLIIYFSKSVIQKIANMYYQSINMLLKIKIDITNPIDFNSINNQLEKFGLNGFQHRVIHRLHMVGYDLLYNQNYPKVLKDKIIEKNHCARDKYKIPDLGTNNKYGMKTFEYFFSEFLNLYSVNFNWTTRKHFAKSTFNNINLYFDKFVFEFEWMSLKFYYFKYNCNEISN